MKCFVSAVLLSLLTALAGGCEINPAGSIGVQNECQRRGLTRGTKAYNRCVRDLEGRLFLQDFGRGR